MTPPEGFVFHHGIAAAARPLPAEAFLVNHSAPTARFGPRQDVDAEPAPALRRVSPKAC